MSEEPVGVARLNPFTTVIWPMGEGVVVTATGTAAGKGLLLIRAVPDSMLRDDWKEAAAPTMAELEEADAPTCLLTFKDHEAIDRVILQLELLKKEFP